MNHRQEETEIKTERLLKMLETENLGGALVNLQPNFAWLTAGGRNGVDTSRENGVASLLVRRDGKCFVLASKIEMPRMLDEEVSETVFEPVEFAWEAEKASPVFLAMTAASLLNTDLPLASDINLGADVRVVEDKISRCRFQLTNYEIERFRALGSDAGAALGELAKSLKPGQTEQEIAKMATESLASRGIYAVVTLAAADERLRKYRHPVPTSKPWEKVVMIVVCARREGLIVSLSRIVCAGEIPEELRRRTNSTVRVNAQILAATRPGATGAEIYKIIADAYAAESFPGEQNLHHQGGAAGYRTRDWVAHPASNEKVLINQAFAWNPSISGTKVEETCIVTENGIEVLTASPDWPQISVRIEGTEYLSPDVLAI